MKVGNLCQTGDQTDAEDLLSPLGESDGGEWSTVIARYLFYFQMLFP